jgi:hypothetical protein
MPQIPAEDLKKLEEILDDLDNPEKTPCQRQADPLLFYRGLILFRDACRKCHAEFVAAIYQNKEMTPGFRDILSGLAGGADRRTALAQLDNLLEAYQEIYRGRGLDVPAGDFDIFSVIRVRLSSEDFQRYAESVQAEGSPKYLEGEGRPNKALAVRWDLNGKYGFLLRLNTEITDDGFIQYDLHRPKQA